MERNILQWSKAIAAGHEPNHYPYLLPEVPLGEMEAMLDFKIWAKKVLAINCYFTCINSGRRFRVTVFCKGAYRIEGSEVDFAVCPVERKYRINVGANQKKNIVLKEASLLPENGK